MKSVLIIDDNKDYYKLIKKIHEDQGHEVFWAHTAREGWETLKAKGMDYFYLIISDITMETPISGLIGVLKFRWKGYRNRLYVVSTGFNPRWNYVLSGFFLHLLGINRIVPKQLLNGGNKERLTSLLL